MRSLWVESTSSFLAFQSARWVLAETARNRKAKVKQAGMTLQRLDMKLETERLQLRSATQADAPHLQALYSSPEVLRYLPPFPPMSLEQATQAIGRRLKMEAELGYAPFIIVTKG